MKPLFAILLIMVLSHSLQGQNKQEKKAAEAQAYLDLKKLVSTGVFTFSADWATTHKATGSTCREIRIRLNSLKIRSLPTFLFSE